MQNRSVWQLLVLVALVVAKSVASADVYHKVCYDAEGWLVIDQTDKYPVRSYRFFNTTGNSSMDGMLALNSSKGDPFWELQFKIPAFMSRLRIVSNRPRDLNGAVLTLLSGNKRLLDRRVLLKSRNGLNVNVFKFRNISRGRVHFLTVRHPKSSMLSFADIKIDAKQVPPAIPCYRATIPIRNGCYRIKTREAQDHFVRYSCNTGFRLLPHSKAYRCNSKPSRPPRCVNDTSCPAPPTVSNSEWSLVQRKHNRREAIKYECRSGYYLEGNSFLTCRKNGTWDAQPPVCLRHAPCPSLSAPFNGLKKGVDYRFGKTVNFSCFPGFRLNGTDTVRCTRHGRWKPRPLVECKAVECPVTQNNSVTNGEVSLREQESSGFVYGNFLQVQCFNGFTLTGKKVITCTRKGTWDNLLPTCTKVVFGVCSGISCPSNSECIVANDSRPVCVCSASLGTGCDSEIRPSCSSIGITFWSECHLLNYTCMYPEKKFVIVKFSQCPLLLRTPNDTTKVIDRKCGLPKVSGNCKASHTRFYFDQEQNKCMEFTWGGCSPNGNHFISERSCQEECSGFQECQYGERFEPEFGMNLVRGQPTSPKSNVSANFVDGNRFYNKYTSGQTGFVTWGVFLKGLSFVKKIVLWNSERNLQSLHLIISNPDNISISKTFIGNGSCRYDWTPPRLVHARHLLIETFPSNNLNLDEVEVYGSYDRSDGTLINFNETEVSASQGPRTFTFKGKSANPQNAVNGIFELNSGPGLGVLYCSSTFHGSKSRLHWLQINLTREYFVTKLVVGLRDGPNRQRWQTGLTPYISQAPIKGGNEQRALSSHFDPHNRCGVPYSISQGQTPTFSCHGDDPTQYIIFGLKPQFNVGIQLYEVQVFVVTCGPRPSIDQGETSPKRTIFFAPAKVNYRCTSGYQLHGSRELSCGKDGLWKTQKEQYPKCQASSQTTDGGAATPTGWTLTGLRS